MIKEDLSKPVDDNHKNSYIKCISDVTVELDKIISQVHSNVNSILSSAKKGVKFINDAKKTTEQILGILETSEENFNLTRLNFVNSYHLWLSDCYKSVIVSSTEAKTNSLDQNSPCNDSITNKNESIIDLELLEDSDISDVQIVNEVKYRNLRKVFDRNDNIEELDSIQSSHPQLTVGKTDNDFKVCNDLMRVCQISDDELPLLDSSFEGIVNSKEELDSEKGHLIHATKSNSPENLNVDFGQKNNFIVELFGSDLKKSELSKDNQDCLILQGEQIERTADATPLNIKKNPYYFSDKKLRWKCFVQLEPLHDQNFNNFTNYEKKSQLFDDDTFHKLIDLSTLEKKTEKRSYTSSDSSSCFTCSSSSKKRYSLTKKRIKRRKDRSDHSDISSFYESSDNDTDDDSSSTNMNLDQFNSEKLDEDEKKAKLQLLQEGSDTSEYYELTDNDENQQEDFRNKRMRKKRSPSFENPYKRNSCRSTWLNDPLFKMKISDDKSHKKRDLKDFNDLGSSSCDDNTTESITSNTKKNVEITGSEGSENSFSDDCEVIVSSHSKCLDSDHSNNDLQTTMSIATPSSKPVGRRNIRKVLDDQEITENTRKAVKDEESRLERMAKRKEQLNYFVRSEESIDSSSLILDFDFNTKSVLVAVDKGLVKLLKPHQKEGVRFMWDCCFESVEQVKQQKGSGCILAHCMGLGKTLQIITLVHTLLVNQAIGIKTVMIVSTMNTILNWTDEFSMWLEHVEGNKNLKIVELTQVKQKIARSDRLKKWQNKGGVLLISYDMFRSFMHFKTLKNLLINPGADLVVCDEGHLLKNEESQLANMVQQVKTKRRIILTGTPLQNNLHEYHCMVQFVKPDLLGSKAEFVNRFGNPIANGQFDNSTPSDVKLMKHRAHVLHRLLKGCVQRRDYAVLKPFLPPKQEYVISVRLSEIQKQMYQHYISSVAKVSAKHTSLFKNYQEIKRLVAHPKAMQLKVQNPKRQKIHRGKIVSTHKLGEPPSVQPQTDRAESIEAASDFWWREFVKEEDLEDISISYKLVLLFSLLDSCARHQDKVLVFSQCLFTLDLIEVFLKKLSEVKVSGHELPLKFEGKWKQGLDYLRLDGRVRSKERSNMCKTFNDPDNKRMRLFLISTKAGGLGINLTGANRVVVFDPSWNPSNDLQSIFRVFRFGQKKPCYVYRFLTAGTMEEKIYYRQVTKLSLSLRVLDEQQVERHYRDSDLMELYKLEPLEDETPTLAEPKDHLLAEVLSKCNTYVYNIFEHESLLENQEEEELDEEEREQAWIEYHQEKLAQPCTDATAKPRTKIHQRVNKLSETESTSGVEGIVQ